jgi:hypothetical protein
VLVVLLLVAEGPERQQPAGLQMLRNEDRVAEVGSGVKEGGAAAAEALARDGAQRLTRGPERPLTQEAGHHGT